MKFVVFLAKSFSALAPSAVRRLVRAQVARLRCRCAKVQLG